MAAPGNGLMGRAKPRVGRGGRVGQAGQAGQGGQAGRVGQVVEAVGGVYRVQTGDGVVEASLRGRVKWSGPVPGKVVIGDHVEVVAGAGGAGGAAVIESVRERRTSLSRWTSGGRVVKVVAANLDRLLVVMSVADPPPSREVIDRMLVMGESGSMEVRIILNKVDLARGRAVAAELGAAYRAAGYAVTATSAVTGEGMGAFRAIIHAGSSALAGPSGVGKSSLLNAVEPTLDLRTRRVGRRSRIGKHTTVSSRLIALTDGGHVADTPGFSDVGLTGVARAELDGCFADFRPFLGICHFKDCTHVHEPGCAVLDAVASGHIQPERHRSYRTMLAELQERGP